MNDRLHELIRTANLEEIRGWIRSPQDIPEGIDPIHKAATFEYAELVSFFVSELGLHVDTASQGHGHAPALCDQGFAKSAEMTELLIDLGADVNAVSAGTPLFFNFIHGGNLEGLKTLLDHGLDLHVQNNKAETAVIIALSMRNHDICKWLVEHSVDVNRPDRRGRTALMVAVAKDDTTATQLLLDSGADPLKRDARDVNCTAYAIRSDSAALNLVHDFCQKNSLDLEDCRERVVIYQIESDIQNSVGTKQVAVTLSGNFDAIPDSIKNYETITSLTVRGNSILETLNPHIFALPQLEELIFEQLPNVTEIPAVIGQATKLKKLHILTANVPRLPDEICNLTALQELKIACDFLLGLPKDIGLLTGLRRLTVLKSDIQFLPASTAQLKALTHLTLTDQDLDPSEIDVVLHFPMLKELDLQNNSFHTIPKEILNLEHLKKFTFKGNPVTNPPMKDIKGGFKGLRKYFEEL